MKKRAKIIAIVSTLCLCLSLFVVGVLSVSTTSLSVTSSLSFKSNGAFVMVDGELRQGATKESATLQSGAPATYTYKGYSYNCIGGAGADKDKPNGTASLENFVDASGATNATWAVGEITFSETLPVAVYHFTFTNYSEMMVVVSVTSNIQELNTDLAGKVSITESFESGSTIDAYDGTTAKTTVYTITVEITDYTTSFENKQLDLTIQFDTAVFNREYFTYNTDGTEITGLSDKYFEDNLSVLIVPGKTESGQNLTIARGSSSSPTFNGLVSPTVILQEGLTSIGIYAFSGCSSLSSISLPESVKSIGNQAFNGCSSLSSINIPEGVTSIGSSAFRDCSSLSSISLPESLTSIGIYAFRDCSSLSSINIPDGVTSIGEHTFSGCSSLSSISLPESVTSIGGSAFYGCSRLSSINIPEGVTSIDDWTFDGCSSLSSITIPESVTSIGMDTFYNCSSLSSINIPEGVTSIGSGAFSCCYALVEIYNYSQLTLDGSSSVGYLGQYALYVYNANDGTEPEHTKISVDGNVQYYTDGTDIIAIGTFGNRNAINEITFKDGTTKINTRAFSSLYALTSVTLPSSVTEIGDSAFRDCSSLSSISLPESVKSIGNQAFNGCSSLSSVTFGENSQLESIGSYAFSDCESLSSINIPSTVTSIGSYAFDGCRSLSSIDMTNVVDWNNLTLGSYSFKTNASTNAPTVITISSNANIQTVTSKLTSSVIGSSMTNKIKFTNGSTTYVWNGSAWDLQTA